MHPKFLSENLSSVEQYIKLAEKTIRSNPEETSIEDYHLIPYEPAEGSTLSSKLSGTRVNGLLSINRNEITDLELAIVETDNKVYRTSFSLDRRWRLCQIHETQMMLKRLVTDFMLFKVVYNDSITESCVKLQLLGSLQKTLIKIYSRLSLPAANSLRSLSRSKLRTIFKPDLPKNLMLNLYCRDGNVNVDLNFIEVSNSAQFNKSPGNKSLLAQVNKSLSSATTVNIMGVKNADISGNFYQSRLFEAQSVNNTSSSSVSTSTVTSNNSYDTKCVINKVSYEVGDEFSHPGMGNAVFKVINTVQLKAEISWLYIAQNLVKEAVDEVAYCLKSME